MRIDEFSRGYLRIKSVLGAVRISGEMTLDPFGFIVNDLTSLVWQESGVLLDDEQRVALWEFLQTEFAAAGRVLQLDSDSGR